MSTLDAKSTALLVPAGNIRDGSADTDSMKKSKKVNEQTLATLQIDLRAGRNAFAFMSRIATECLSCLKNSILLLLILLFPRFAFNTSPGCGVSSVKNHTIVSSQLTIFE